MAGNIIAVIKENVKYQKTKATDVIWLIASTSAVKEIVRSGYVKSKIPYTIIWIRNE